VGEEGVISYTELRLAARNHGLPLEALRYPVTPVGLHYLLTHYDIPYVDPEAWRLEVGGLVSRPLSLSLDDIRRLSPVELVTTMECAGNGRAHLEPRPFSQPWLEEAVGTGRWRGARLREVLDEAGVRDDALEIVFAGLDRGLETGDEQRFERSLPVGSADVDNAVLAYEIDGRPLPPQHGFPLRLVVPGWYGMTNVKWLGEITAVAEPFTGHQQAEAYCFRESEDDPGIPLTRMLPRSLLIPPGIPDYPTRLRWLHAGPCVLEGRAWSGSGAVEAVDVSTDGGEAWRPAELVRDVDSPWAWLRWRLSWDAEVGEHVLVSRARDSAGNAQPVEPIWNVGGYTNNAVQRVRVMVV
jgi:DMSO/TMAO reductase YedYZ molybdopterin-dependent catalytic subunit